MNKEKDLLAELEKKKKKYKELEREQSVIHTEIRNLADKIENKQILSMKRLLKSYSGPWKLTLDGNARTISLTMDIESEEAQNISKKLAKKLDQTRVYHHWEEDRASFTIGFIQPHNKEIIYYFRARITLPLDNCGLDGIIEIIKEQGFHKISKIDPGRYASSIQYAKEFEIFHQNLDKEFGIEKDTNEDS